MLGAGKMRAGVSLFGLLVAASLAGPANAGVTTAPPAFYVFCQQQPAECQPRGGGGLVTLTPARLQELRAVNSRVNASIREVSDQEHHGRPDVWSIPTDGRGDCEDFALTKRHQLIELGWPSSALLMTVVRNQRGEGHAVLTVVTDDGDLILNNQTGQILDSADSGLTFFTRQSTANPRVWVTLPREGTSRKPGLVAAGR